jgi:hypothetical protein
MNDRKQRQRRRGGCSYHDWLSGYDPYSNDYLYLLRALYAGGAIIVDRTECRASLRRAGLMEPTPYTTLGRYLRTNAHTMRLTKAGKLRAEAIVREFGKTAPNSVRRLERRNYHRAIYKQQGRGLPYTWGW